LTTWHHPNGETITHTISNARRITQITSSLNDSTHPGTLAQNIHYGPQGAVGSLQNGCAGSGCTQEQETYDYNNRLQMVRIQLGTSAAPNANACTVYNYYSGVGNPTTCSIPSQASSGNDRSEMGHYFQDTTNSSLGHTATLTYDNMNRLVTSVATGSATHNLTFSYDRYGYVHVQCPRPARGKVGGEHVHRVRVSSVWRRARREQSHELDSARGPFRRPASSPL